jgi:hypothetical protein
MVVFNSEEPPPPEWSDFVELLKQEVRASRDMQNLLTEKRRGQTYRTLHRPLKLG